MLSYMAHRGTQTYLSSSIVDVIGAVDGRTVEVLLNKRKERVMLAGVGFPAGDQKSESDALQAVHDVIVGRRLYMHIHKEVEGCRYVSLKSSNGDCFNSMLLNKGIARYDSTGVGFLADLVEAESIAKNAEIGIWDKNRALFRHLTKESETSLTGSADEFVSENE